MRRLAFYRRPHNSTGFKESVVRMLGKRPPTGLELAEHFGMRLPEFNKRIYQVLIETSVVKVVATEWAEKEGIRDRTYSIERRAKRITPPRPKKTIPISLKSLDSITNGMKQKHIDAAKRRAKLIASGEYRDWMG